MATAATRTSPLCRLALNLLLGALALSPAARSQWVTTGLNAIDVPADPRTIAMGESSVGLPANPMALSENPAGLVGLGGVGALYAQRQFNWLTTVSDARYHSAAAYVSTDLGTFSILYNRLNLGEADVLFATGPGSGLRVETHNHLLALGFARSLTDRFSAGIALKGYTQSVNVVQGNPGSFLYETTGTFMVDLGILYAVPQLLVLGPLQNALNAGLSIQNFGTDFRQKSGDPSLPASMSDYLVQQPRYLRIGASYVLTLPAGSPEDLVPFALTVSGEYRGLLNPSEHQESDRDFYGFGAEVSVLELVTGRAGGFIEPYSSIYGNRAVPSLRYGIALTFPLRKLGVNAPFRISADYAGLPLTDRSPIFGPSTAAKSTLRTFSFQLVYTDPVF